MKQNTLKLSIAFLLTAIAAFTAGLFCDVPQTTGRASGDVGRAKVYTKSVVSVDADNLQERLQSDTAFCASVTKRSVLMQSQAHALADLIEKSNAVVGNKAGFESTLSKLNAPYQSVMNACSAIDQYVENLAQLSDGSRVPGFEQSYNNALLGYYLVSGKTAVIDAFRDKLAAYLSDDNAPAAENAEEMKALLGEWANYSISSAVMTGDVQKVKSLAESFSGDSELSAAVISNQEQMKNSGGDGDNLFFALSQDLLRFENQDKLGLVLEDWELIGSVMTNHEQLGIIMEDWIEIGSAFCNQEQLGENRNL